MKINLQNLPLIEELAKHALKRAEVGFSHAHAVGTLQFQVTLMINDMRKALTAKKKVDLQNIVEARVTNKITSDEIEAAGITDLGERAEYLKARATDNTILREVMDKAVNNPGHDIFKGFTSPPNPPTPPL